MKDNRNNPKYFFRAIIAIAVVILLVFISGLTFKRFDLTEEKRHSLNATTKEILEDLKEPVFFKVYLKGEYPKEFKRLEKGIREKLDEMKADAEGLMNSYSKLSPA